MAIHITFFKSYLFIWYDHILLVNIIYLFTKFVLLYLLIHYLGNMIETLPTEELV